MMDHRKSRAARSLLGWSQQKLADSAGVALATVQFFETDKREPISNNLAAIRRALEDAGVEFIPAKSGKGVCVCDFFATIRFDKGFCHEQSE
jgi:transcriptional regulator with XRE-family HTH domain